MSTTGGNKEGAYYTGGASFTIKSSKMKEFLYGSEFKRVIMRFVEIFVFSGAIALMESPDVVSLVPAVYVGILAATAKVLRARLLK